MPNSIQQQPFSFLSHSLYIYLQMHALTPQSLAFQPHRICMVGTHTTTALCHPKSMPTTPVDDVRVAVAL